MPLDIGSKLQERYEIVRFIKSGGMGSVCEARDLSLANSPCAIKEILENAVTRDDAQYIRSTFEKEMRALVALDHPCIPKVRDYFVDGDKRYIVMDYLGGNTLEEEIRQHQDTTSRGIPAGKAVTDILALLDIVIYLHGRSPALVHRDIKPANIIREEKSGRLKLVDFGLARVVENLSMQTMVGTWGFCAPEQLAGKAEAASDLYSVGCTLHHMLTGTAPRMSFEPLELDLPGLRPGLSEILTRATQPRPSERYTTAQEMAQDLRDWLDRSEGKVVRRAPRIVPKNPAPRENSWAWATVVVMALSMGLLGGRVFSPPAPSPSPTYIMSTIPAPDPQPPVRSASPENPVALPRQAKLATQKTQARPEALPQLDKAPQIPQAKRAAVTPKPTAAPAEKTVAVAPAPVAHKPVMAEFPRLEEQPTYPQRLGVAPTAAPPVNPGYESPTSVSQPVSSNSGSPASTKSGNPPPPTQTGVGPAKNGPIGQPSMQQGPDPAGGPGKNPSSTMASAPSTAQAPAQTKGPTPSFGPNSGGNPSSGPAPGPVGGYPGQGPMGPVGGNPGNGGNFGGGPGGPGGPGGGPGGGRR